MTFSEQWLREHEARQAAYKAQRAKLIQLTGGDPPDVDLVTFTLAKPFPLLNRTLRIHWAARRRQRRALADEIARLDVWPVGAPVMLEAIVTITRYSIQEPDKDNLYGGAKGISDCLLVKSDIHPDGLGIVFDDSPSHMTLIVRSQVVRKRAEQRTEISIQRIG